MSPILTNSELAQALKVPLKWVKRMSQPSRTDDPIPLRKAGRDNLYITTSPEFRAWLQRNFGLSCLPTNTGVSEEPFK